MLFSSASDQRHALVSAFLQDARRTLVRRFPVGPAIKALQRASVRVEEARRAGEATTAAVAARDAAFDHFKRQSALHAVGGEAPRVI